MTLSFSQDLTREQQIEYNQNKLSIQKTTSYSFLWWWGKSYTDYNLFKGYNEIDLEEFATIYGDEDLLRVTKNRESSKIKWVYFGVGTALLVIPQDENGVVEDWARIPATGSFVLFTYYLLKDRGKKSRNSEIIPVSSIEEMIEQYNNQLLKEITNP